MDETSHPRVFKKSRRGSISLLVIFTLLVAVGTINLGLERLTITLFGITFNLRSFFISMLEAGVVGGIADWYAVTCLFRSPFGIDTRHTRLLPRKKNEIARGLTAVIKRFLPREVLAVKVQSVDYSGMFIEAVNDPDFRRGMKRRTAAFLKGFLENVREFQTHRKGFEDLMQFARKKDLAAALAVFLQDAVQQGIFESVIPQAAQLAENYVRANRSMLEEEIGRHIRDRVGWFFSFFLNPKAKDIVDQLLDEIDRSRNPDSEFIKQIKRQSMDYSTFVLSSERDRELLNDQIHQFLGKREVQNRILALLDYMILEGIKFFDATDGGPAEIEKILDDMVTDLAEDIAGNQRLCRIVNDEIAAIILGVFYEYNLIGTAADWIRDEIQKLSDEDFTGFVEEKLYNDLQFIRVSGAITGSLVGGLLYVFKEIAIR